LSSRGPGIFVAPVQGLFGSAPNARIDGFGIRSADLGGAIYVNAYASNLQISNNRLFANASNLGGGIRVGNPTVQAFVLGSVAPTAARTPDQHPPQPYLRERQPAERRRDRHLPGRRQLPGDQNNICGNLCRTGGGGISHLGRAVTASSPRTTSLQRGVPGGQIVGGGGGIEIAGELDPANPLTRGAGNVTINRNRIQGNLGGSLDGGGIALNFVNGQDVLGNPNNRYRANVTNNMIVNNVTGMAGAASRCRTRSGRTSPSIRLPTTTASRPRRRPSWPGRGTPRHRNGGITRGYTAPR